MMAVVDPVTGMVYWVPTHEYQAPVQAPFAPVVMPYRYVRHRSLPMNIDHCPF
jgi:hypothetical protein